ncbi:hypothetical protein BJ508DRAFT_333794 [Ascobolus immersus RN42]|uniref:CCHC-type domain-containing protein n=1 Tax=Ascobolus immersus RN42 TaxID=1160509 RepID=A0A3N4HII9_ASCIM|nr:hypothetical protein BJ508DRAFT_333794 [Ascobolus immersus RN42]
MDLDRAITPPPANAAPSSAAAPRTPQRAAPTPSSTFTRDVTVGRSIAAGRKRRRHINNTGEDLNRSLSLALSANIQTTGSPPVNRRLDFTAPPHPLPTIANEQENDIVIQILRADNEYLRTQNAHLLEEVRKLTAITTKTAKTTAGIETMLKAANKPTPSFTSTSAPTLADSKWATVAAKAPANPKHVVQYATPAKKITFIPPPVVTKPLTKRDRRLIVRCAPNTTRVPVAKLVELRSAANSAIATASKLPNITPSIGLVSINRKGNYIMTTTGARASDYLLFSSAIEKAMRVIDQHILSIEADKKWYKLIVDGISTSQYDDSTASMAQLRNEIESYNSGIALLNNPRWLKRPEHRTKARSSCVIVLDKAESASLCVEKGLNIDMRKVTVRRFVINREDIQCSNCQEFGHHYFRCSAKEPVCRFCGSAHRTSDHSCTECPKKGIKCGHLTPFCHNCKENGHIASDNKCPIKKTQLTMARAQRKLQSTEKQSITPAAETPTQNNNHDEQMEVDTHSQNE